MILYDLNECILSISSPSSHSLPPSSSSFSYPSTPLTPPFSIPHISSFSFVSFFSLLFIDFEWPFKWQDETEGYMESQLGREKEIMQLTGSNERWENWMQYIQVNYFTLI